MRVLPLSSARPALALPTVIQPSRSGAATQRKEDTEWSLLVRCLAVTRPGDREPALIDWRPAPPIGAPAPAKSPRRVRDRLGRRPPISLQRIRVQPVVDPEAEGLNPSPSSMGVSEGTLSFLFVGLFSAMAQGGTWRGKVQGAGTVRLVTAAAQQSHPFLSLASAFA
ncbi:hypothetical protein VTN00DRAFT_2282 [Thermoascus crustaceus]|uniref:uncharacterized protein n=1 Tax=Thermoascus crustaceus TaxID=5088 RepID=UPI0037447DEB